MNKQRKLEIALAMSLPYGIKGKYDDSDDIWTFGLDVLSTDYDNMILPNFHVIGGGKCRLIYHPLSDLTKPIKHNGEKFVPYKDAGMSMYDIDNAQGRVFDIGLVPFHIVLKLCEWHFQIFNLPSNQWIDVNTLNENPYK